MARTKKPTKKLGQKEKVNITTKRRNNESGSTHSVNKNDREENEVPNLNQTKTSQKKNDTKSTSEANNPSNKGTAVQIASKPSPEESKKVCFTLKIQFPNFQF